jgi:NADH-quinone oxidoreductase subunit N
MAFDLIAWAPEVQLCTVLLAILFYGTGPAVSSVAESWWVPFQKSEIQMVNADAGPKQITVHQSCWTVIWCLLGAWLVFFSPIPLVFGGGVYIRDSFTQGISTFLLIFSAFAILVATFWLPAGKIVNTEYLILISLAIFGQHLIIQSADLMSLYLSLELQSFALVVLCSLNKSNPYSIEAGMKYFLLSAFSSCLLLLGIGLIYWETGVIRISHLTELFSSITPGLCTMLGIWLISLGLLWKLAAAPMHFWAADVYQGAWTSVSLLISTLPKIAVLGFWCHQWHKLWTLTFGDNLIWFSAGSLLIGAIAPLAQVQFKRLLAFSSVGHMGFMLMPLVGGSEGYTAVWVYLVLYCITNLAVWGLLLWPFKRQNNISAGPQYLSDLTGIGSLIPTAGAAWTVGMLSLAGLPPIAGFLGKMGLFWWGLNSNQYALVIFALLSTLISSVYYLRVLKIAFVDTVSKQRKGWGTNIRLPEVTAYCISLSVIILVLGLWHGSPLILTAHLLSLSSSINLK